MPSSLYSFRAPLALRSVKSASMATLLFFSFFFFHTNISSAQESFVPPPGWLSEEYMTAEVESTKHMEASSQPVEVNVSSFTKTFIISAYYSPIAGQQRYVTGSLFGDIRLNGSGVNGADGTPVYPGMIAAPKTYAFGTKMHIPGVGTVAVHDRGGAIVHSGQRGNAYDRLDVWMGYGDKGLQRALNWGKRTVDVTVYGVDPSVKEYVELDGYSESERQSVPNSFNAPKENVPLTIAPTPLPPALKTQPFSQQLAFGHVGDDVAKLQRMLKGLNYYTGDITSVYDSATYKAVESFQVEEGIILAPGTFGAGYVGPRTMSVLALKEIPATAHAESTTVAPASVFHADLKLGTTGEEVRQLQEELRRINLLGIEPSGSYDEVTQHAVFKFQQIHGLVGDMESLGAGIFGPITRTKFNAVVAARLDTDRERLARASQ